jgi:plastocyanin
MHHPTNRTSLSRTILSRVGLALMALLFTAALIPSVASAKTVKVTMTDKPPRFVPAKVTIKKGDTVKWVNTGKELHSATFNPTLAANAAQVTLPKGAKPFGSGFMAPGATFSHKFTVPGIYHYICIPHEKDGMLGEVIVKK